MKNRRKKLSLNDYLTCISYEYIASRRQLCNISVWAEFCFQKCNLASQSASSDTSYALDPDFEY
jgi:hypothetical protein